MPCWCTDRGILLVVDFSIYQVSEAYGPIQCLLSPIQYLLPVMDKHAYIFRAEAADGALLLLSKNMAQNSYEP